MIIKKGQIDISEIKRCYVDITIEAKCPDCTGNVKCDLSESYLSYPEVPSNDSVPFYCDNCEDFYDLPVEIVSADLVVRYDPKKVEKQ